MADDDTDKKERVALNGSKEIEVRISETKRLLDRKNAQNL